MKNLPFSKNEGLFTTASIEMLLPPGKSPSRHYDSVTVTTLVVKENGECLLKNTSKGDIRTCRARKYITSPLSYMYFLSPIAL